MPQIYLKFPNSVHPIISFKEINAAIDKKEIGLLAENSFDAIHYSIKLSKKLAKLFEKSAMPLGIINSLYKWFFDDIIGNTNFMRTDISERFNGIEFTLKNKCSTINGMLLKSPSNVSQNKRTVVILCNANGDYYEYIYFQNPWIIPYFLNLGIDVIIWNYRCYGLSKGILSPSNLKSDGELVVNLARSKGYYKIGVYGHSLGGDIACNLAKIGNLDFLFADRTYGDIVRISRAKIPKWLSYTVEFITGWKGSTALDYMMANCYKVMTNDPNDEMINDYASLKALCSEYQVHA